MNEKVRVAIPSYNSEKFIGDAVKSIFKQSYPVDEIIICDDCSSDLTVDIVKKFRKADDRINIYINSSNLGYQRNWNNCLKEVPSDFVLILHQDDMLKPDTIEKQLNFLKKHPKIALVGGSEDLVDEYGNIIRENQAKETKIYQQGQIYEFVSETGSYIPCSSVMFNMNKIRQVGFFDADELATDELYWPKVLSKFPIAVMGESLIYRRYHPGQAEYSDFIKKFNAVISAGYAQIEIISGYEKRPKFAKKIANILKLKFSLSSLRISRRVIKSGKLLIGFKYSIYSIKFYPSLPFRKAFWKTIAHIILDPLLTKKTR